MKKEARSRGDLYDHFGEGSPMGDHWKKTLIVEPIQAPKKKPFTGKKLPRSKRGKK